MRYKEIVIHRVVLNQLQGMDREGRRQHVDLLLEYLHSLLQGIENRSDITEIHSPTQLFELRIDSVELEAMDQPGLEQPQSLVIVFTRSYQSLAIVNLYDDPGIAESQ